MKEPKIRLKGFSGEWEETSIGDISTSFSGGTPSVGVAAYYGGDIPFIRSGEIGEDRTQLFITKEGLNSSSARMVDEGTLLYALYGATSGEVSISKINGAINQAILAIYPKKGYSSEYLSHYLRAKKESIVGALLQGGQGNLSGALVKGISISLPKLPEEQKAVATYLDSLDSLIQSTTKKIESLKQVKAASLQSMFPQQGETTPRVRFKGFDGEWEKVELGKLLNYEQPTPYLVSNADYEANGIPVLTAGKTFILGYTSDNDGIYTNLPVIIFDDFTTDTKFVTFPFKAKSSAMKMLNTLRKDIDIRFVYETLNNLHFRVENHQRHWLSVFSKIVVLVPSFEEQQKIASYFTNLDSQITLQTQRLEKLKQIKSACLDNMFV